MYVCICLNVTDSAIRREAAAGACSLRHLRDRLGVSTQCGKCAPCAKEVLQDALAEQNLESALAAS